MKFFAARLAHLCALGLGALSSGAALAEPNVPAPAASQFSATQIVEAWGWLVAHDQDLAGVELDPTERAAFLRGASLQFEGRGAPYDLGRIHYDTEKLAEARHEKLTLALKRKNMAEADAFFATLQKNPGVVRLPSGLRYEVIEAGHGATPTPQQTVNVHYTGRLIDGTEFVQVGPYDLVLVPNRIAPALFEGMQKISAGGRIKLYVPPPLPAEEEARLGISPGSATVYEVELFGVKATPPDELANSLLPSAPEPPPPPPSGFTTTQMIETWGRTSAQKTGAATFQLGDAERAAFLKGLAAGIADQPPASDLNQIRPIVRKFVADQREKIRLAARAKRRDAMNALFAELKKNPAVVELPDGLRYQILQTGSGPFPKPGQIVIVDYTGTLLDGTVFDRTDNEPLHVEVGSVIPGWNEGIQKINRGGMIKLYVPPSLGYGDENMSGVISSIPAGSALVYEIKLLAIEEAAPESSKK